MPDLVLASTSRYRRALLHRLGVPFRCHPPGIDEDAPKSSIASPLALAEALARAKAGCLAEAEPGAIVIGGDQLVEFEGRVYGKPGSTEAAVRQLAELAGRSHRLITSIAVRHGGGVIAHTDTTVLHMRPLRREEIERYVAADRPFDCAGSYKLEEMGIVLFDRIESSDQSAITGLPLIALTTILRGLGFEIP